MGSKVGIKETKEAIVAGFAVYRLVYAMAKDGIQASDAWTLMNAFFDYNFRMVINEGLSGIKLVKDEILNLDRQEITELWALVNAEFVKLSRLNGFTAEEEEQAFSVVSNMFSELRVAAENG